MVLSSAETSSQALERSRRFGRGSALMAAAISIGMTARRPIIYRMRIALLTHQWPGARMGGIGAAVRQCAAALAGAGHDVHVFTPAIGPELLALAPEAVTVHEVDDL